MFVTGVGGFADARSFLLNCLSHLTFWCWQQTASEKHGHILRGQQGLACKECKTTHHHVNRRLPKWLGFFSDGGRTAREPP